MNVNRRTEKHREEEDCSMFQTKKVDGLGVIMEIRLPGCSVAQCGMGKKGEKITSFKQTPCKPFT